MWAGWGDVPPNASSWKHAVMAENKALKKRLEQAELENAALKSSLYELSVRLSSTNDRSTRHAQRQDSAEDQGPSSSREASTEAEADLREESSPHHRDEVANQVASELLETTERRPGEAHGVACGSILARIR